MEARAEPNQLIDPPVRSAIKTWQAMCAEWGCVATGARRVQIHHCMGRKARIHKVQIGEIFILPLWYVLHDVSSNHKLNVTHHRKAFVKKYGRECDLFAGMVQAMKAKGLVVPFQDEFVALILETGR